MSISEQFIKFVFSSDPAIKLDHAVKNNPYSGCAIGKFAVAQYPGDKPQHVSDMLAADVEFAIEHEELLNDYAFFNMDIDNIKLMTSEATTMGQLAHFIRTEYPRIAELA